VLILHCYYTIKLLLEKVQHRFTLLFDESKALEYNERLVKLKIWSLEERRNRAYLIELMFKMVRVLLLSERRCSTALVLQAS